LSVKNEKMKIAFCFDLDGTLTNEEILPKIAKHVDLVEEIDLLTTITMQGQITFNKSFRLRVKLLSTIPIQVVKETVDKTKVNSHLKSFVNKYKDNCFIVTGNLDVWVNDFIQKEFGCRYFSSTARYQDEKLLDVDSILNKKDAIQSLKEEGYDYIVTIGDGMNDCSMFEMAHVGVAYGGVHEPVSTLVQMSRYVCYDASSLVNLLESIYTNYSNEN
jgi:HAD superfamily phosphoserine phosphatase-like hydrolase